MRLSSFNPLTMMAFVCGGLFTDVSLAETSQQEMLRQLEMLEQLDDMDRQTFNRLTDEADSCAGNLNFTCVKQKLADARPLIIDDRMQQRFRRVRGGDERNCGGGRAPLSLWSAAQDVVGGRRRVVGRRRGRRLPVHNDHD